MARPRMYCWWNISGSSATAPGSVGWVTKEGGWPAFIQKNVLPALAWAAEADPDCGIMLHSPHGKYRFDFHIDGYDFAKGQDLKHLVNGFTEAQWRPVVANGRECVVYVGSIAVHPDIANLPGDVMCATIRRNLKPFQTAKFNRICIDASCDGIVEDSLSKPPDFPNGVKRSINAVELAVADSMFPMRTAVESTPRRWREWADLCTRDVYCIDNMFLNDHGTGPQSTGMHPAALTFGRGERSYLKGRIHRWLHYSDDTVGTIARAKAIVADGDVVMVQPEPLIAKGVKASELLAA